MLLKLKFILDIEGFLVNGKFVPKELGVIDVDTGTVESRYYRVGRFVDLSVQDRRQAVYLRNNIHGLQYENWHTDLEPGALENYVVTLCGIAENLDRLIGYKGGHYEHLLLQNLGYAHLSVNIEDFQCPRFDILATQYPSEYERIRQQQCVRHKNLPSKFVHCPRVELLMFYHFMKLDAAEM